jgi:DNA-binding transcriptional MerR regulator
MPAELSTHHDALWSLPELVDVANALLPAYLPKEASGRSADEVNPRLVRHYTTLGLLPEALKDGREARYVFDHLLQLLVVRKLLAEGFSSSAIGHVIKGRSRAELQSLLDGAVRIDLVVEPSVGSDPRLAFLRDLRQKAGLEAPGVAASAPVESKPMRLSSSLSSSRWSSPAAPSASPRERDATEDHVPFKDVLWSRIDLLDGLELHVRDDFRLPGHRLGDEQIAQLVKVVLLHLEQSRRGKP